MRIDRNPDGSPDDITIPDPIHVHAENMGRVWWVGIDTPAGRADLNFSVELSLPRHTPPWLRGIDRARLLRWMQGRARVVCRVDEP